MGTRNKGHKKERKKKRGTMGGMKEEKKGRMAKEATTGRRKERQGRKEGRKEELTGSRRCKGMRK